MWCIGELGLSYERYDVGHKYGGTDSPKFLTMNPNATVPVLLDGDSEPLWETGAILRYLAGRYGSASFWPTEGCARASIDKWAEWSKINVTLSFTSIFWKVIRTAPLDQDSVAISHAIAKLEKLLDIAEARLSCSAFLGSNDFSLADIHFGHILFRYFDIPIDRKDRLTLRRYYDTLAARPAFREHVMVSYEDLRVS
jgi:glutathione S-transferase